jgi:hypothetical protein
VIASLRAAAHAAVDRADTATVAAIMAAIELRRAVLAGLEEPVSAGDARGAA